MVRAGDNVAQMVEKMNYNFQQIALFGGGPMGLQGFIGPPGLPGPEGLIGLTGPSGPVGTYVYTGTTAPNSVGTIVPSFRGGDVYIQGDSIDGLINFWVAGSTGATSWSLQESIDTSDGVFTTAFAPSFPSGPTNAVAYPKTTKSSNLVISDLASLELDGQILSSGNLSNWLDPSTLSWQTMFGAVQNQIRIFNSDPFISGPGITSSIRLSSGAGAVISLKTVNAPVQVLSIEGVSVGETITNDKFFFLAPNVGDTASIFVDTNNRVAVFAQKDTTTEINNSFVDSLTVFGSERIYDPSSSSLRIDSDDNVNSFSRFYISKGSSFSNSIPASEWEFRLGASSSSTDRNLRLFSNVGGNSDFVMEFGFTSTNSNSSYIVVGGTEASGSKGGSRFTVIGAVGPTSNVLGVPRIVDFQTSGGTSSFSLDSNGDVVSGLKFGNSSYDSSNVHTLDHYEEGSWNLILNPEGFASLPSWNSSLYKVYKSNYTRIGNLVKVDFSLKIDGLSSSISTGSSAGNLYISGFPFKPDFENVSGTGSSVIDPLNPCYPLVPISSIKSSLPTLYGGFVSYAGAKTRMYLYEDSSNLRVDSLTSGSTAVSMLFGSFEYFISSTQPVPLVNSISYSYLVGDSYFNIPLLPLISSDSPITSLTASGLASWMVYNPGTTSINFAPGVTLVPGPSASNAVITVTAFNAYGSGTGTVSVGVVIIGAPVVRGLNSLSYNKGVTHSYGYTASNSPILSWTATEDGGSLHAGVTFSYVGLTATLTLLPGFTGASSSFLISAINVTGTGSTSSVVSMATPIVTGLTALSHPIGTSQNLTYTATELPTSWSFAQLGYTGTGFTASGNTATISLSSGYDIDTTFVVTAFNEAGSSSINTVVTNFVPAGPLLWNYVDNLSSEMSGGIEIYIYSASAGGSPIASMINNTNFGSPTGGNFGLNIFTDGNTYYAGATVGWSSYSGVFDGSSSFIEDASNISVKKHFTTGASPSFNTGGSRLPIVYNLSNPNTIIIELIGS